MCEMKEPVIRFKGYTDEWEQRKLGDIASFSKGTGYSKADLQDSGTPIILYGRLYTKYETVIGEVDTFADEKPNSVFSKGGEVIVPASGETAEDISVASVVEQSGVMLGGDLNIITPPQKLDSAFLAISISNGKPHSDMAKMAQGKSVVHLHNSDLAKINLSYPSYEEQRQISHHFKNLDHLIILYQRKCDNLKQVKKYMLQKMFPKQGEKVPEIRFAGFTGDWEQRKLGDVTQKVQGNDGRMNLPTLTISAANGWMNQVDRFSGNIAGKEQKNYTLLRRGELSYNHGNSKLAKYGTVFALQSFNEALVPRVYHSFKMINGNSDFIEYYFSTKILDKELAKLISSGARMDGLLNISYDDFMGIKVNVPSVEEQNRISDYLRKIDNFITLHQRKVDSLKEIKKFMLQNMFPK